MFLHDLPGKIELIDRDNFILDNCRNKKVLHLGCTDGKALKEKIDKNSLLHIKIKDVARDLWGIDIDGVGIKKMQDLGISRLILGNIEQIDKIRELEGENFDVIIAGEIVEHLDNVGLFLEKIKKLFSKNTVMIVSIPNCYSLQHFLFVFFKKELVHDEHNCSFSFVNLMNLFEKFSYTIKERYVSNRLSRVNFKQGDSFVRKIAKLAFTVLNYFVYGILRLNPYLGKNFVFVLSKEKC